MGMGAAGCQGQHQRNESGQEPQTASRPAAAYENAFPARLLHALPRFNFSSSFSGIIGTAKNSGKDTHCLSPFAGAGDWTG
jgi:hypothetical protein